MLAFVGCGGGAGAGSGSGGGGGGTTDGGATGGAGGGAGGGADAGSGGSRDGGGCHVSGFAAQPNRFALPSAAFPPLNGGGILFPALANQGYCTPAVTPSYAVTDLTGDGKPDMVRFFDCADPSVGNDKWQVYVNTGTGFAATPTAFALPSAGFPPLSSGSILFPALANQGYCTPAVTPSYAVTDLTGDGKPDMVRFFNCADPTVGNDKWQVYVNTGTGFAATPTAFALPSAAFPPLPSGSILFPTLANQGYCTPAVTPSYAVTDLTGDGKPDMVRFFNCADPTVGNDKWQVYVNTGTGFAATATAFALPSAAFPPLPSGSILFPTLANQGYCTPAVTPSYAVTDLTGDRKPDMVRFFNCADPTVGNDKWQVYVNTGTGFAATATAFALPSAAFPPLPSGSILFPTLANQGYCTPAVTPSYAVTDLTADGKPDMVRFFDCVDPTVGNDKWQVYVNTGTGFAATATAFALPSAGFPPLPSGSILFPTLANQGYCTPAVTPSYAVTNLTGDGRPSLVLFYDCHDATVGNSNWLLFPSACVP